MIFLSFDIEEFDIPQKHNPNYKTMELGMDVSIFGTNIILDILASENVKATFFCTANFAIHAPNIIQRIANEGHEIASHGYNHSCPRESDIYLSKIELEKITGMKITGFRQPQMMSAEFEQLLKCGYKYNASINPTFIPGRYNHLLTPRYPLSKNGIVEIPASVTPFFKIPLFWFSIHVLPFWLYKALCFWTLYHDKYFNTYFHPWEFYPLTTIKNEKIPILFQINTGHKMCCKLRELIKLQ